MSERAAIPPETARRSVDPLSPYQIAAAVIGNALEWYDFTIYFYLATTLARLFFPGASQTEKLLSALAAFGVAFVFRPLGGVLFGRFADLHGRKATLLLLMGLMTVGIALVAFAPTYAAIGLAAPCLIVMGRILQGLSASGEFASATTFLIEHAPPGRRGFYGGWQMSGQGLADVLAASVGLWMAYGFTPEQLEGWAWRAPFLIGLVIGPIGLVIRSKLSESPEFLAYRRTGASLHSDPLVSAAACYKRRILIGMGVVLGGAGALYVADLFMPTYAITTLGLSMQASFLAPLIAGLIMAAFSPLFGSLSDRVGRKPVMATAIFLLFLAIYPAFQWLNASPSAGRLALLEAGFGILAAAYAGPLSTAIAELFPVGLRATGSGIAYNVGIALFGGFAPLIVAWLISRTGDPLVPAYYVMAGTVISFAACLALPRVNADSDPS
jgi:MFS family permease